VFGLSLTPGRARRFPALPCRRPAAHGMVTRRSDEICFNCFRSDHGCGFCPNHVCMTAAAHDGYHVINSAGDARRLGPGIGVGYKEQLR
jgi:hypothetical protein